MPTDDATAPQSPLHRLLVIRHAKSDYPFGVVDHDRPLNARGRRDAPFIGSWIARTVPYPAGRPPLVLVSSARRAQLTWELARNGLGDQWRGCEERTEPRIYEAGLRTLLDLIGELQEVVGTAAVVGHNPTLRDLVAMTCPPNPLQLEATAKFPTSSVAVLTTDLPWAEATAAPMGFGVEAFTVPRA